MLSLRKNQKQAIHQSIQNDFKSGIHYHATGSGKSIIALSILREFTHKYPQKNILWICEQKTILNQIFSKANIQKCGFNDNLKKYNILNFTNDKNCKWYQSVNAGKYWGKPILCIINRAFLTSQQKYKLLSSQFDLIIHDECHSVTNATTTEFYKFVINQWDNTRCIGFTATPELSFPYDSILTKYTIYDAFCDEVILPPKIVWYNGKYSNTQLIQALKQDISRMPYQKVVVWCGMISHCYKTAEVWKPYFPHFKLCIDTSIERESSFGDYDDFYNERSKTILFCAVKHREGSDIPNLDTCVFLDKVVSRTPRTFIQSIGRTLRLDRESKKSFGLIVDISSKNTMNICNRVQKFLQIHDGFPWIYKNERVSINLKRHTLTMSHISPSRPIEHFENASIEYLRSQFLRSIPNNKTYIERLDKEVQLIREKNLTNNILQALEILELTKSLPHVTRGSCGSSLVCYLLGISHIDPIKFNISFARFINQYRDTLPDIDFDFPHFIRDEVFLELYQRWGNRIARISNHNYFHEKSAKREAIRRSGIRHFIPKNEVDRTISSLSKSKQKEIKRITQELENSFRGYSLHCGGVIYFPDGIPSEYILEKDDKLIPQVYLNKHSVSAQKTFKIDILSSRALSQLYKAKLYKPIDFNCHFDDEKTQQLFARGDNIGITLAESPLIRKAFKLIQPKTLEDVAKCLAIIRPAAKDAKEAFQHGVIDTEHIVYDDDAIQELSRLFNCDEEYADKLRRGYMKRKKEITDIVDRKLAQETEQTAKKIKRMFNNLREYGFCKAHAFSYAQLVWQLGYMKAHHPQQFWKGALEHCQSSYRKWVHLYEAELHDVYPTEKQRSIYSEHQRRRKFKESETTYERMHKLGYWYPSEKEFFPNCYCYTKNKDTVHFRGIIASSRMLSYKSKTKRMVIFLGIEPGIYIECILENKYISDYKKIGVRGVGRREGSETIQSKWFKFF